MSYFSSLTSWLSGISITMDMLIILCLTEFLMLAIIGLVYLFRKNKNLSKVVVKLQTLIKSKKNGVSRLEQISTYFQEQICLSELQHETLKNCKNPEENTEQIIKALSGRLIVLNSELLTLPEYIENDDNYWSNIYTRYAQLTANNEKPTTDGDSSKDFSEEGSVETLDKIETIDEEMLVSLGEMEDEYDSLVTLDTGEDNNNTSSVDVAVEENTLELTIKDTASEEIGRLRDIINRQYNSIDELKLSVNDIQSLSTDVDNQALNEKFTTLKNQMETLVNEQEQFNMCINVLEQENLRLGEEILQYQNDINNSKGDKEEYAQSQSVTASLIQTNKEQLQCISILEDEIESLKKNQSEISSDTQLEDTVSSDKMNANLDELKFKLSDKDSEIGLLREEYDMLKQKYEAISQKVANG